jgi:superoxide dismutase
MSLLGHEGFPSFLNAITPQPSKGMHPLLVVDVWEHSYLKDFGATSRAKYVDTVKSLIQWPTVEKRFYNTLL